MQRAARIAIILILVCSVSVNLIPRPALAQIGIDAPELRALLTRQLSEQALLVAAATNAIGYGSNEELQAVANAFNLNSQEAAQTIDLVYGDEAGNAFLPLWRLRTSLFVDYARTAAAGDAPARMAALEALDQADGELAAFLAGVNPNLSQETITQALAAHTRRQIAVIDAQMAQDYETAYRELRLAYEQALEFGLILAGAVSQQFPERFPGEVDAPAVNLRVLLSAQLAEFTFLTAATTNAALQDRAFEFVAATQALDDSASTLAATFGSVYGQEVADALLALWRRQISLIIDYTEALLNDDTTLQTETQAALDAFREDFGAFLASVNPALEADTVTRALAPHIEGLLMIMGAQERGDYEGAYRMLRTVYAHAHALGKFLAAATIQQFPNQLVETRMPNGMPATGFAPAPVERYGGERYVLIGSVLLSGLALVLFLARRRRAKSAAR